MGILENTGINISVRIVQELAIECTIFAKLSSSKTLSALFIAAAIASYLFVSTIGILANFSAINIAASSSMFTTGGDSLSICFDRF